MGYLSGSGVAVICCVAGCAGAKDIVDPTTPVGAGVAVGVAGAADAIVEGVSALESGGWTAAAVVVALGLVKAGVKGWTVANKAGKNRRLKEIAEGLKLGKSSSIGQI